MVIAFFSTKTIIFEYLAKMLIHSQKIDEVMYKSCRVILTIFSKINSILTDIKYTYQLKKMPFLDVVIEKSNQPFISTV